MLGPFSRSLAAIFLLSLAHLSHFALGADTDSENVNTVADVFVSNDKSLTFALNVDSTSDDLYFSLSGSDTNSWISIGFSASQRMAGAFVILAYSAADGNNVTISPRIINGDHVEPEWYRNATIDVLPGTGFKNGTMTANGRCRNCRSWNGGSLDVGSGSANMIFALSTSNIRKSDSLSADTRRHTQYGVFTMDLVKATGPGGLPTITNAAANVGSTQVSTKNDFDAWSPFHAVLMVFTFLGVMPLALLILRVINSPRFHAIFQVFAAVLAILGAGIGIYIGLMYNRTKNFQSGHQIFGLIIMFALIIQVVLGYLHHRLWKQTQMPTKLAPFHVWLGRLVIPLGVIDGFLGFPLALSPSYNIILGVLLAIIFIPTVGLMIWGKKRAARKARKAQANSAGMYNQPPGYVPPFGSHDGYVAPGFGQSDVGLADMGQPPAYGRGDGFR